MTSPFSSPQPSLGARSPSRGTWESCFYFICALGVLWRVKSAFALGVAMFQYLVEYGFIYNPWAYSAGVLLSIFTHEFGHYLVLVAYGKKVSAINFVPLMGAFVAHEERPHPAPLGSVVALSGPLAGTGLALLSVLIYRFTENPLFLALAYFGFFMNLINLLPIWVLDGQKATAPIRPLAWLIGLIPLIAVQFVRGHFNIVLVALVALALPRIYRGWNPLHRAENREYSPRQSFGLTLFYFALVLFLAWVSNSTFTLLKVVTPEYMGD